MKSRPLSLQERSGVEDTADASVAAGLDWTGLDWTGGCAGPDKNTDTKSRGEAAAVWSAERKMCSGFMRRNRRGAAAVGRKHAHPQRVKGISDETLESKYDEPGLYALYVAADSQLRNILAQATL